ncbi:MAG TPA: hypothetical protein VH165_09725 [Kofleriaceae bacterium]|nr:hypothetical protein [Kofleriaceae bacterium]
MAASFLDAEARKGFEHAVQTIENASAAEVVIAIRRRSAHYLHAHIVVGVVAAFAGLAVTLFSEDEFSLVAILIDPFVIGLLAGGLVELWPWMQRTLTPVAWRSRQVLRGARATFVERGVHNTTGRTGILVYVSWLEREVRLVFDSGLERTLPAEARDRASRELTAALPAGGAAVARALEELAAPLGVAVPHRDDDVNELPDAIDSELAEAR